MAYARVYNDRVERTLSRRAKVHLQQLLFVFFYDPCVGLLAHCPQSLWRGTIFVINLDLLDKSCYIPTKNDML